MRYNMKREITEIVENYQVNQIEAALVKFFLDSHNIKNIKNKLLLECLKNNHNEELVDRFKGIIKSADLKSIERVFELLIEPKDRKLNGAFYTPEFIVKYIVDNTIDGDVKVCDPSCGSGAFLIQAAEKIHKETDKKFITIIENNIYGCDILDYAIRRTKLLLSLFALSHNEDKEEIKFNLICKDSLMADWTKEFHEIFKSGDWKDLFGMSENGFDVVIGNPPYVRIQDFGIKTKNVLVERWTTANNGNFNLHFPFFELGTKILKKGGKLGYITPNNYFTSLAAEPLRRFLQNNELISKILDFNHLQIFEDVTTYTCITFIEKSKKSYFEYQILEEKDNLKDFEKIQFSKVFFKNLDSTKWRVLNEEDYENIKIIESIGKPLKEIANIHVGIATLNDKLYFVDGSKERENYFIKEIDNKSFLIEKQITRAIRKISSFENEEEIEEDKMRIICPYTVKNSKAEIIPEEELKKIFPKCYAYLLYVKDELSKRDKGKKIYPVWYAYGRGQGINKVGKKLLTPTFSNKPKFMLDDNEYSLFCNGYAIFQTKGGYELKLLQKILNSVIMDYFARKTSVDLEGGYQCYQKNFIESFNIPLFNKEDVAFLQKESEKVKINDFLIRKYGLNKKPFLNIMKI